MIGGSPYQQIKDLNGEELVLCPTVLGWPRVGVPYCNPHDAVLVYPARGLGAHRPTSTTGLSELVGTSRAAILQDLESARKLARRLEAGTARIMSATVRRDGGRWHVSFTCEVERAERAPA